MRSGRQHGAPLYLSSYADAHQAIRLERVRFERAEVGDSYDEAWLQKLLQAHPELLPINEIEPAYWPAIPVCMELPTSRGFIDNFFITPSGNLIFAEVKLWRNSEARREVIAQVMDYAESLTECSYGALEAAARKAPSSSFESLYELVEAESDLDEAEFADAVSRNLRLGRGLFFIVGDGIREEAETLAEHVQSHAGMHFAIALLELACHRLPEQGGYVVQPRTIARTVNIERGIVRIDDSRARVGAPERKPERATTAIAQSLTAEDFLEKVAEIDASLPKKLQEFLARVEPLGVRPEFKKTLILRWHAADGTSLNIGYITTSGEVWTDAINARAEALGVLDAAHEYVRQLAAAVSGETRAMSSNPNSIYVIRNGRAVRISELLERMDAWEECIRTLSDNINARI